MSHNIPSLGRRFVCLCWGMDRSSAAVEEEEEEEDVMRGGKGIEEGSWRDVEERKSEIKKNEKRGGKRIRISYDKKRNQRREKETNMIEEKRGCVFVFSAEWSDSVQHKFDGILIWDIDLR